jgi:cytochrome P450
MSALFFYLIRHSEIYVKLALEIRKTFADLEEIRSGEKLQSCSYLSACIAEALRMSPPVPGIPWREVEDGGIQVDTDYVPAGYTVGT